MPSPADFVPAVRMQRGSNFLYAMPDGWMKTEESNTVLSLINQQSPAIILVVGVSGLMQPMSPDGYAHHQIVQSYSYTPAPVINLRFTSRRAIPAMRPYQQALALEVELLRQFPGEVRQVRGIVFSNVSNVYGRTDCMMTWAGSRADLWDGYRTWLPETAAFAVNVGPNPFNLGLASMTIDGNVRAEACALHQYQAYSQQLRADIQGGWQHSQDLRAGDSSLTGQQWYDNPYGGSAQRLSAYQRHWVNDRGEVLSFDNPNLDPNTPQYQTWRPMPRHA